MKAINISSEKEYSILQVGIPSYFNASTVGDTIVMKSPRGLLINVGVKEFLKYFHVPEWSDVELAKQIFDLAGVEL